MIHYYAQKGIRPSEIYNASEGEKVFLYWSMATELERKENIAAAVNKSAGCPLLPFIL